MVQSAKKIDENELADQLEAFEVLADRATATKKGSARALAEQAKTVIVALQREVVRLNHDLRKLREHVAGGLV